MKTNGGYICIYNDVTLSASWNTRLFLQVITALAREPVGTVNQSYNYKASKTYHARASNMNAKVVCYLGRPKCRASKEH